MKTSNIFQAAIISIFMIFTTSIVIAGVSKGKAAPDFTLKSMSGDNFRLNEMRGKVVMVNFWATWCAPCRKEMPLLNEIYNKHKQSGFVLIGINIDDSPKKARKMVKKLGINFPILFDSKKQVSKAYDVSAMPFTVILDKGGRVAHIHEGYLPGYEKKYDAQISNLLGK